MAVFIEYLDDWVNRGPFWYFQPILVSFMFYSSSSCSCSFPFQYTLQMFAVIYRDFAGKLECGDFKFMGIACIPAIPVIFEVNYKKVWTFNIYFFIKIFSNFLIIFAGISGVHVIPVIITCTLQGTFCNPGIPCFFHGGKICSVET